VSVSGGNTERKGAREKYGLLATTDFDSAFNQVLTDFGYEIVDYADVVSECGGARENEIKNEFAMKDEISDVVRKKAIKGARDCEVRFFALGFMNVGLAARDPVSGELKVPVSVNGHVWNIDKRLPTRVASVGPVQFFGLGPDKNTARRNALDLAAKKAAQLIASQLSSKNLN
jgi:hypothetical protein